MKLLAVFCLAAVAAAATTQESRPEGPECPLLKCVGGSKVACIVGEERCSCRCVQSEDPCESIQDQPCLLGKRNHCTTQDITCKCRCVPV
ncbi:uncharacterized protein LOC120840702 [Ixodes scapularis]|uniref:uncharacterized protein LOC120840702 n=1 Tax=Ixodes scapularis TaxID=6945 RepID=UPI001A9EF696|nr:uncharacterized protein LOC120840702 [Ixodes scapularis]